MANEHIEGDPYFDLYIALKRLRTAMWQSFPPMVFVRWLCNKHPKAVIPFSCGLFAVMMAVMVAEMATPSV